MNSVLVVDEDLLQIGAASANPDVPGYSRVDATLIFMLAPGMRLSFVGQNLLDPSHWEFFDREGTGSTEIPRSASAKLAWRF